jgi:hypothetical protein
MHHHTAALTLAGALLCLSAAQALTQTGGESAAIAAEFAWENSYSAPLPLSAAPFHKQYKALGPASPLAAALAARRRLPRRRRRLRSRRRRYGRGHNAAVALLPLVALVAAFAACAMAVGSDRRDGV